MASPHLSTGSVWRLRAGEREVARLTVTGSDMPWVRATVVTLPGFALVEPVFAEQERALEREDWDTADACYQQIGATLTMSFPNGEVVPEFLLRLHGDKTASRRWLEERVR